MDIVYGVEGAVATVTLNRPEVRNALRHKTYGELELALVSANEDPEVGAVIITGSGEGFCSGDDVKQVMLDPQGAQKRRQQSLRKVRAEPTPVAAALMRMDKPVIAAVNGAAVGWGMDLALMCDIRIASERARFGELFVLRGLIPDVGGVYCLPRIVGLSKAYELLFTGDIIEAEEALRIGLVSKAVPHGRLMAESRALAERIAGTPPGCFTDQGGRSQGPWL